MRARIVLVGALAFAACSTTAPSVQLKADPVRFAHLDPAVAQPIEVRARTAQEELDRDLKLSQERLGKAEAQLRQAQQEPRVPALAEVHDAKIDRAAAELRWQRALADVLPWRSAVATAANELAKAEVLSRTGQDVDMEAFTAQHNRLRTGQTQATQRAAAARARFEEADRKLNAAKERYAKAHVAAAP